jgi:tRNA 2-thiouridine synthesizing protein A
MVEFKIDKALDVIGMVCPRPMIMTMSTLKTMEKGQVLQVKANDSSTKHSIPALCERGGYKLLDMKDEAGTITFVIQK